MAVVVGGGQAAVVLRDWKMNPRRLQSATIFSIVTVSVVPSPAESPWAQDRARILPRFCPSPIGDY